MAAIRDWETDIAHLEEADREKYAEAIRTLRSWPMFDQEFSEITGILVVSLENPKGICDECGDASHTVSKVLVDGFATDLCFSCKKKHNDPPAAKVTHHYVGRDLNGKEIWEPA